MRSCGVNDEQLRAFAEGRISDIEDHVFSCDDCQRDLALMWEREIEIDIADPVVQAIRMDWLVSGIASTGFGVAGRLARALIHYLSGRSA